MSATTLTLAGQLATSLLAIPDRSERMEAVAGVCAVLADALEGTDAHQPLDEAATNARAEAELWAREDQPVPLLGRVVDRLFQPEEA